MLKNDESSLAALFQACPVPMWVYDLETLAFVTVNAAAIAHYGYSKIEFLGMTITDVDPSEDLPKLLHSLRQTPATIKCFYSCRHRKKDGTLIDVEITSHTISFGGRACKFVLAHDITERLQAQNRIARLNRIYAILSSINSAIIRIRDRQTLFEETCRIATTAGEFVAACIAVLDPDTLEGSIAAKAGGAANLLEHARLTACTDTPDSEWPACRAMREQQPVICNDIRKDPVLASLDSRLVDSGHQAMAAFPLTVDSRVVGVLVLLATTTGYFDDAELKLLNELAANVAFALEYIDREEERKRITDRLRESEAGLRRAQNMSRIAHVVTRPGGSFESWSETLPQLIGLPPGATPATIRQWLDIVHPDDREKVRQISIEAGKHGTRHSFEYRVRHSDGTMLQLHQVLEPLEGYVAPDGEIRWFNTIQDITEQKAQEERIARLSRIYAVLSGINSAIVRIHQRDALFQEACRIAVHEGAFSMAWIGTIDPATQNGRIVATCGDTGSYTGRIKLTAHADSLRPSAIALRESRPVICNDIRIEPGLAPYVDNLLANSHRALAAFPLIVENRAVAVLTLYASETNFFDDEEVKLLNELAGDLSFALQFIDKEEKLSYLAYYDALTGLPNGRLFQDRLAQLLHSNKHDQSLTCVILLNLERFAHLNDALGRHAGDALLAQIGQRLLACLGESTTLARISGDMFAVAGLASIEDGGAFLQQRIFAAFAQPFSLNEREIRVSAKAGLALYPTDGTDGETLFKHAEVALKKAKLSGERYLYYSPQMNAALSTRLALETELQQALQTNQFVIHYQPRVDLTNGRIVSAEALIRWQHPTRGLVAPGEFIPVAEDTGMIVPLGAWVIDAVCAQQAAWLKRQLDIVPVAINLSAAQCKKGHALKTINSAIVTHGIDQQYIEFELTESVVMDDPEEAASQLHALKKLGMRLSLDDFGTGYSSLAYLKRFPFDFVKIDRAFVTDVTKSPEDAAIATAVIAMAHSLNLRVIAEGVETEGQLQFLRKHRCDELQGYYFSRPVPADAFEAMLREDKRLACTPITVNHANTLLLVDDESNNLSALNRLLRRDGYRILTASSGEEALELMAVNRVQVIISDQCMPGMSGSEFLCIAKELYPDTMRIILSSYADLAAVTDGINRGAIFKFLTKPWDDDLLRENIRDAFRRYRPSV